jgi:sulfur carrier protein
MMIVDCLFCPGPRQLLSKRLTLPQGARVVDAIDQFKLLPELQAHCAAIELALAQKISQGIWGRKVPLSEPLKAGDRLEIYRPLLVDPKLARKQRFKRQGKGRTGLFARRRVGSVAGY